MNEPLQDSSTLLNGFSPEKLEFISHEITCDLYEVKEIPPPVLWQSTAISLQE
jgi:hypothetical protein